MSTEPDDLDEFFYYLEEVATLDDLLIAQSRADAALAALAMRRELQGLTDEEHEKIEEEFCRIGSRMTLRQAWIERHRRHLGAPPSSVDERASEPTATRALAPVDP